MSNYAQKLFDVSGKVVVVTGGGAGIGLMITNGFVKAGAKVFISSRKKDVIEKVARDLTAEGPGECHAVASDLSTKDGCKHLVSVHLCGVLSLTVLQELQKTFGVTGVHVLVNNSGANWGAPLEEYPEQAWEKVGFNEGSNITNLPSLCILCSAKPPVIQLECQICVSFDCSVAAHAPGSGVQR